MFKVQSHDIMDANACHDKVNCEPKSMLEHPIDDCNVVMIGDSGIPPTLNCIVSSFPVLKPIIDEWETSEEQDLTDL